MAPIKRRIKKADVTLVSLVPRGANRLPVLYKEDGTLELAALSKFDEPKGELLTLVYIPETGDAQGDAADHACIEGMAKSWARNGFQIDERHNGKPFNKDQVYLVENFIVQKGDPRFADWKDSEGNPIDATNGWGARFQIDDPEIRKKYGSEGWEGVSLFAPAGNVEVEVLKEDDLAQKIVDAFTKQQREKDMDAKELAAALAANNEALVKALAEALKPAPKEPVKEPAKEPVKEPANEMPILKAEDRSNPEKVKEHVKRVQLWNLQKLVDWNDDKSVQDYLAKIETPAPAAKEESEEVKDLRTRLEKALAASSQPIDPAKPNANEDAQLKKEADWRGVSVEDVKLQRRAAKAAEQYNQTRFPAKKA